MDLNVDRIYSHQKVSLHGFPGEIVGADFESNTLTIELTVAAILVEDESAEPVTEERRRDETLLERPSA
jgi:hypothetical protein